jgi:nitric oxide synthase-interacting protein
LFCRECALENLVAQARDITRAARERERRADELRARGEEERRAAQESEVGDFERLQAGLPVEGRKRKAVGEEGVEGGKRIRRAEGEDKAEHSFWIPAETPSTEIIDEAPVKVHTVCPLASESEPHAFSLKTLVEVHFTTEPGRDSGAPEGEGSRKTCPACRKTLSNATKAVLAVPCGHVVCKPCADKFLMPAKERDPHAPDQEHGIVRCYVCDADLTTVKKSKKDGKKKGGLKPGLVEIQSEGTGFAGGGKSVIEKEGVSFQC